MPSYPYKSNKVNTHEDVILDLKNQNVVFHKGFSIFLDSCISNKCKNELKYQINNYIRTTKSKEIDVMTIYDMQIPLVKF